MLRLDSLVDMIVPRKDGVDSVFLEQRLDPRPQVGIRAFVGQIGDQARESDEAEAGILSSVPPVNSPYAIQYSASLDRVDASPFR